MKNMLRHFRTWAIVFLMCSLGPATMAQSLNVNYVVSGVNAHNAVITWDDNTYACVVQWREQGSSAWNSDTTYSQSCLISGLASTTTYDVRVFDLPYGVPWGSRTFTTTAADSCPQPLVMVSQVTPTSVSLQWAGGTGNNTWQVQYKDNSGLQPWQTWTTTTDSSATITDLPTGHLINFRVITTCDSTMVGDSVKAYTACGMLSLPYYDKIDPVNSNSHSWNPCWTTVGDVEINAAGVLEIGNGAMIISPLTDQALDSFEIVLHYDCYSWIDIFVCSNPLDPTTYTRLPTRITQYPTYKECRAYLYTGDSTQRYIEIEGATTISIQYMAIQPAPRCIAPTDVQQTFDTLAAVGITWNTPRPVNQWQIRYYDSASDTPTYMVVDTNRVGLPGLPGHNYEAAVRAICGEGDTSDWSPECTIRPSNCYFQIPNESDTLTTMPYYLMDDDNMQGSYSHSQHSTTVLNPPDSYTVELSGRYSLGLGDTLRIYDGIGTDHLVHTLTGEGTLPSWQSVRGPATVVLDADDSLNGAGFKFKVQKVYSRVRGLHIDPTVTVPTNGLALTWYGDSLTNEYINLFLWDDADTLQANFLWKRIRITDKRVILHNLKPNTTHHVRIHSGEGDFTTGDGYAVSIRSNDPSMGRVYSGYTHESPCEGWFLGWAQHAHNYVAYYYGILDEYPAGTYVTYFGIGEVIDSLDLHAHRIDPDAQFIAWNDGNPDTLRWVQVSQESHFVAYFAPKVGINEVEEGTPFALYPNPCQGTTTVTTSTASDIEVVDMAGRVVRRFQTRNANGDSQQVQLSGLKSGAYFVRIISAEKQVVQKLIVK